MKRFFSYCSVLLLSSALSACYPSLYFGDRAQTTAFTGKDQFVMNASLKPQSTPTDSLEHNSAASYSLDAAYSFDENWAFTLYYSNVRHRGVKEDQLGLSYGNRLGGVHSGNRYEAGVTYFKPNEQKNGIAELSAGISMGNIARTSRYTPQSNFKTSYRTIYGQAAYGFKSDAAIFSVGAKIWLQNFYDFDGPQSVRRAYNTSSNDIDIERYPFVFTSLFYNFEFGYRFLKFNSQMGLPIQINGRNISGFPFYATFGMVFRLEKDFFKNNKQIQSNNEK